MSNQPIYKRMSHPVTVAMYTALSAHCIECAWRFKATYPEPHPNEDDSVHLRAANQYWRDQLLQIDHIDTRDIRTALILYGNIEDFARLFATVVAPRVVSLDLPHSNAKPPQFFRNQSL